MGQELKLLLSAEMQCESHGCNLGDDCNHTKRNEISRTRETHGDSGFHRLNLLQLLPLHAGLLHANFRDHDCGQTGQGSLQHDALERHRVLQHHDSDIPISPKLDVPLVIHVNLRSHRLGKDHRSVPALLQKTHGLLSPELSCRGIGAVRGHLQHHCRHLVLWPGKILLDDVLRGYYGDSGGGGPEEARDRPPDGRGERRSAQVGQVNANYRHMGSCVHAIARLRITSTSFGPVLGTRLPLHQNHLLPGLLTGAAGHRARVPVGEVPQRAILSNRVRPPRRPGVVTTMLGMRVLLVVILRVTFRVVVALCFIGRGQGGLVVGSLEGLLVGRGGTLEQDGVAGGCTSAPHIGCVINQY
mmetsp:Transcript_50849/g.111344  ORF Transcript_50849/g.111344 Transcript_50849/m.111344 type:complete len:357 (+) Transcript_50849:494-1564(+)